MNEIKRDGCGWKRPVSVLSDQWGIEAMSFVFLHNRTLDQWHLLDGWVYTYTVSVEPDKIVSVLCVVTNWKYSVGFRQVSVFCWKYIINIGEQKRVQSSSTVCTSDPTGDREFFGCRPQTITSSIHMWAWLCITQTWVGGPGSVR